MTATLARLVDLAGVPRAGVALSAALGVLAVGFGVGLMTTAGYLISRAAEQPPILSLTVDDRRGPLLRARAADRPLPRAPRLARRRAAGARPDPRRASTSGSSRSRPASSRATGAASCSAAWSATSTRSRGSTCAASARRSSRSSSARPASALHGGVPAGRGRDPRRGLLLAGGSSSRCSRRRLSRAAGAVRRPPARELTAELVELLRGAPELVVYGREAETLARVRAQSDELARLGRRDALSAGLAEASRSSSPARPSRACSRSAADASLDRVLVATLALLALASFESVTPLLAAARELSATLAAGRRVLELVDREPAVRDPRRASAAPRVTRPSRSRASPPATRPARRPVLSGFDLRLEPGRRVALVGPSGAGKTTVANLLLRFLDPEEGRVTIGGLRPPRAAPARRAADLRARRPGRARLQLDDPREPRPRTSGRDRRAAAGRARPRPTRRVGRVAARRSGHARRRGGRAALRRPAPALDAWRARSSPTRRCSCSTSRRRTSTPRRPRRSWRDVLTAAGERSVLLITHRPEGLDLVDEIVVLQPAGASSAA